MLHRLRNLMLINGFTKDDPELTAETKVVIKLP